MKPTVLQVISFLRRNDARLRSSEAEALTKKIWRIVRRESPKIYWSFWGSIVGLLALITIGMAMVFIDVASDPMVYLNFTLVVFVLTLPILAITGLRVFIVYFNNHPEDFPR